MFNNVALDVAIGLVFIYLLYSLLATTIKEFVATIFSYRSRMLELGIEQMLDGKNYSYYWWNKIFTLLKIGKKKNKKTALFAAQLIAHPLYRRLSENSLFFKKPAYLTASTFSDILIDILKPDSKIPILLKDIAASIDAKAVDNNDPLNADLQKILKIYLEQANGDLQRFKLLIENWYDDTMDRVSGWYKKQSYRILLIIGLVLAITFNVSTLDIVNKLSTDKTARDALVQNASNYIKNNPKLIDTNDINPKDPISFEKAKKDIAQIKKLTEGYISQTDTVLGLGWNFSNADSTIKNWWLNIPYYIVPKTCEKYYFEVRYVLTETFSSPRKWLGFLITALAISLGAPFWFDLLNKFINLRVSGAKPDDKSSTPVSKTALLNQKPNPKSFA